MSDGDIHGLLAVGGVILFYVLVTWSGLADWIYDVSDMIAEKRNRD